ncbi:hypothetical protein [Hydrogenimonas urashimensis]|uniref:hypothetical protein n=1 Tax=Hydrogenimonas urashimensis TaxID=2740515 RepID=UPI0019163377|nr:hypothetical protein [Hydrogenimonas urashimensis]
MNLHDKTTFLMETIPSEKEVLELKRRYLLGGIETELLLEASRTLQSSSPDTQLIEWAYAILKLIKEKRSEKREKTLSTEEKIRRIIALFSNHEDLQRVLKQGEWDASQKRAIDLVAHLVTHNIPLSSNIKIVEKVYSLLSAAYIPNDIAARYFGKDDLSSEKNFILERYSEYRARKKKSSQNAYVPQTKKNRALKRYSYIIGGLLGISAIFLSGFFTAKFIYENRPAATVAIPAKSAAFHGSEGNISGIGGIPVSAVQKKELELPFVVERQRMQESLEEYGMKQKVDFATRLVSEEISAHLPSLGEKEKGSGVLLKDLSNDAGGQTRPPLLSAPMKVAILQLEKLHGLRFPLATDRNVSSAKDIPAGFRLKGSETVSERIVYATDGSKLYPIEVYSFGAEPSIIRYSMIEYRKGHFIRVVSDIWRFSNYARLRTHRHFVYQNNHITPVRIVTNHFLPDGKTVEVVSVTKEDAKKRIREMPYETKVLLADGRLLLKETYGIDHSGYAWSYRTISRIWYDDGKKILSKRLSGSEENADKVSSAAKR